MDALIPNCSPAFPIPCYTHNLRYVFLLLPPAPNPPSGAVGQQRPVVVRLFTCDFFFLQKAFPVSFLLHQVSQHDHLLSPCLRLLSTACGLAERRCTFTELNWMRCTHELTHSVTHAGSLNGASWSSPHRLAMGTQSIGMLEPAIATTKEKNRLERGLWWLPK